MSWSRPTCSRCDLADYDVVDDADLHFEMLLANARDAALATA
mgnify:CR=1 FL=1|tara:strand:- start:237 stop:362 length:126 start_codon:yes stop_codon:yes gene_type:complete